MVHDVQAIREDLAFMRALAQEGRRAPLLVGQGLISGGLVYGAASLFAWAVAARVLAIPRWWEGMIWLAVSAAYVPYVNYQRIACRNSRPGATALTNRAVSAGLRGLGFALLSLMAAFAIIAYQLRSTQVFAVFPSAVMAIYGAAWTVAAAMTEARWLRIVTAGCFAAAVLLGFTAGKDAIYLVYAASMFLLVALPGWVLKRGEPTDVV